MEILTHLRAATIAWLIGSLPSFAETKIEAVPDQATYTVNYQNASGFSGLTWVGGSEYFSVSDRADSFFVLKIQIDPASGKISEAAFGDEIQVKTKLHDFEGIAWMPKKARVYVSCENGNGIEGFNVTGTEHYPVEVPEIFQQARHNKSLESLTYGADAFWTANEDALECDGPLSSAGSGALVRLQKFDSHFKPLVQFAYRTEPSLVQVMGAGTGLSDLCALPNGELLTLERVVSTGLIVRIYKVDFTGATDTSAIPSLLDKSVVPVHKTLLYERNTIATNFEGIALGRELADGSHSLVLIADSGGRSKHDLMPLRIRFDAAEETEAPDDTDSAPADKPDKKGKKKKKK